MWWWKLGVAPEEHGPVSIYHGDVTELVLCGNRERTEPVCSLTFTARSGLPSIMIVLKALYTKRCVT
jgi:hypothetical protein